MNVGEVRGVIRPLTDEAKVLIKVDEEVFLYFPTKAQLAFIDGEGFLVLETMMSPYKKELLLPPGVRKYQFKERKDGS
jgi:hypothetical protein